VNSPPVSLPGFGKAIQCNASENHAPKPLRFVWHHILPQEAGGLTEQFNLLECCDSCHYGIHVLLWDLATHDGLPSAEFLRYRRTGRAFYAMQGYLAAVQAGTLSKIPKVD
jgi:hypothetical protein